MAKNEECNCFEETSQFNYPLSIPMVITLTRCFWKIMTHTRIGMVAMSPVDERGPHATPLWATKEARRMGKVSLLALVKIRAKRYSFQLNIRQNRKVAIIPGRAIGKRTNRNACIREQPSARAASSISLGISSK